MAARVGRLVHIVDAGKVVQDEIGWLDGVGADELVEPGRSAGVRGGAAPQQVVFPEGEPGHGTFHLVGGEEAGVIGGRPARVVHGFGEPVELVDDLAGEVMVADEPAGVVGDPSTGGDRAGPFVGAPPRPGAVLAVVGEQAAR